MTLSLLLSMLLMQGVAPAKGGVVSGTLRGPQGQVAAHVRVGVMAIPEAGRGVRGAGTLVSQVESDDAGRYQLEEVPPGRYYIVAGKVNTPTFYPGVLKFESAKTIDVRAQATVGDIDFELDASSANFVVAPALPVIVTGRIVLRNNPNAPMPPFITLQGSRVVVNSTAFLPQVIQAMVQPSPAMGMSMTAAVAPSGSFNVTLPVGNHTLSAVSLPQGYSLVSVTSGGKNVLNQPLDVKAAKVDLLVSVDVGDIRPTYRLIALVREDTSDRPLAGEYVELVPSSGEVVRLTVNAQGMVTFPSILPGTYAVRLVSAGFEVPEKQVVITDGSAQVELRVRKKP